MELTLGEIMIPHKKKEKVLKMTLRSTCNVKYPLDHLEAGTRGAMTSSLAILK